jgi:hypothetical protein
MSGDLDNDTQSQCEICKSYSHNTAQHYTQPYAAVLECGHTNRYFNKPIVYGYCRTCHKYVNIKEML